MASFQAYDPAQVIITVGARSLSGFADGTFVRIARDTDSFTKYVGSDGVVARTKTNNFSGSITVTLMQTSPDNNYLSALLSDAENSTSAGAGVFNVQVVDKTGSSIFSSSNAWIRKPPDVDYSREFSTREWTIDVDKLEMFSGGNQLNINLTSSSSAVAAADISANGSSSTRTISGSISGAIGRFSGSLGGSFTE